jgi:beta-glucosidase
MVQRYPAADSAKLAYPLGRTTFTIFTCIMPIATPTELATTIIDRIKGLAVAAPVPATRDYDAIISSLSLPEKVFLLSGSSFTATGSLPKHDLHKAKVSDAQTDVRGDTIFNAPAAAVFPNATALASTWDVDMLRNIGAALADEMKLKDVDCLLAPTLNLHRDPRGGRNQESYSEDPFLAGKCGSALVQGQF